MANLSCPSCSAEVPAGATACPACGLLVESDPTIAYVALDPHGALTAEEAAHVPGITGYALVVSRGPTAGETYVLTPGTTTVGRHPDSEIFLDDITVSRHHCRFVWDGAGLSIEDSGSTNGTYVNEARVDRSILSPGDEVLIGRFHLIVAHGDG